VVIQRNSRKLLMMDILMSETCWTHKKWKNSKWHQVGLLFFNYHNDARSNKHKINIDNVGMLKSGAFAYPMLPWKHVDVAVSNIKVSSVAMEMQQ